MKTLRQGMGLGRVTELTKVTIFKFAALFLCVPAQLLISQVREKNP